MSVSRTVSEIFSVE